MNEAFSILIDSRSRFETGIPGGEWVKMPTTQDNLLKAMERIGINNSNSKDFFINGIESDKECVNNLPFEAIQKSNMNELNHLASLLSVQNIQLMSGEKKYESVGELINDLKNVQQQKESVIGKLNQNKDTLSKAEDNLQPVREHDRSNRDER